MTHVLVLVAFAATWPLGALLCVALVSLYMRAMG